MEALTLHQPYATLIVLGLKPWETRAPLPVVPATVIGERIAIHAGLSTESLDALAGEPELLAHFRALLQRFDLGRNLHDLPRGAVLGTARVAGAWTVYSYSQLAHQAVIHAATPGSSDAALAALGATGAAHRGWVIKTDQLGDYRAGRRVILMTEIERFATPVAARGYQGWWPWKQQEALL